MVQDIASSQPPPSAYPLMAAMDGLPMVSRRRNTLWPNSAVRRPMTGSTLASSAMSAPETNDFSPAPVRMSTRTLSSFSAAASAWSSSRTVCAESAFRTSARLMVTVATPSAT
jgi:hypothetical protein